VSISPVRVELAGDPGGTVEGKFEVYNNERETKTFFTSYQNFDTEDETGTPRFLSSQEGLATWISAASKVTVAPGQRVQVPFKVAIPRDAEPGGYFSAIFISTVPPEDADSGQISLGQRVGTLLLLRVNGNISEKGGVLEFGTPNKKRVFNELPIAFYYRFQNNGADRVKPEGLILVRNLLGLKSKILTANPLDGSVLPASIRRFESKWINAGGGRQDPLAQPPDVSGNGFSAHVKYQWNNFALGLYTANLEIAYGQDIQQAAIGKYTFFVLPWQLMVVAGAIIVVIAGALWVLLRRYRLTVVRRGPRETSLVQSRAIMAKPARPKRMPRKKPTA
jgi:hypothetical protein